jgi:hypothetical protein
MHTIEEQVVAFRIRTLRYSHDITSKLVDLIEQDIREGWSSYDPDTEILTMGRRSGRPARVKITDEGFIKVA